MSLAYSGLGDHSSFCSGSNEVSPDLEMTRIQLAIDTERTILDAQIAKLKEVCLVMFISREGRKLQGPDNRHRMLLQIWRRAPSNLGDHSSTHSAPKLAPFILSNRIPSDLEKAKTQRTKREEMAILDCEDTSRELDELTRSGNLG